MIIQYVNFFKIKLAWIDSELLIQKNLEEQALDQKLLEILLFGKHAQDVLYVFYYYSIVEQNKLSKLCDIFNIIINEYNNNLKLANNTALLLTAYTEEVEKRKNTINTELKERYLLRFIEIDEKRMDKIAEELGTLLYKSISGVEIAKENFAIDYFAYQKNILQNKLSFQERVNNYMQEKDLSSARKF